MPGLIGRTSEPRLVHITYNSVMRLAWPNDWQSRSGTVIHACDGLPVVKLGRHNATADSFDWETTDSVVIYLSSQHMNVKAAMAANEEGLKRITCPTCTVIVDIALSAPEEKPPYTSVEDSQVGRFIEANIEQLHRVILREKGPDE